MSYLAAHSNGELNGMTGHDLCNGETKSKPSTSPVPRQLQCTQKSKPVHTMIHFLRVFSVFNKLFARNLRFRDRSVKVIQYGCQMISGYFSEYLSPNANCGLINLRRAASNSRKWFWLLKSVQHVFWLQEKTFSSNALSLVGKYDYAEQIFLVIIL